MEQVLPRKQMGTHETRSVTPLAHGHRAPFPHLVTYRWRTQRSAGLGSQSFQHSHKDTVTCVPTKTAMLLLAYKKHSHRTDRKDHLSDFKEKA